jgi:toxin ParE1/3/4
MGIYFVSPQAGQDLQSIHDYLFVKNPDTANKFLDAMAQKFEILANFPNMGRRRDELSPILRSFPVVKLPRRERTGISEESIKELS